MSSEDWQQYKMGDIVDVTQGLAINAKTKHLFREGGIPLLRITDLFNNHYSQFLSKDEVPKQCIATEDEIIYTRTGQVGFVFTNKNGVVHNNCFKVTPKKDNVSREFVYWFLRQETIREHVNTIASGSVQKDLTHSAFKTVEIKIPNLQTQKRIASIFRALDDRITLLRETNATLEAIAQAMFKSWFVDFDPVHAKQQGRTPEGMDEATAVLFPDSFEESELGLVPKGWEVAKVGDVAEVIKGKSYSSKDLAVTHDTALVSLKSFERGGGFRLDGFKPYSGSYKPSQVVVPGDLIIAYTDVTQAAELIGKPAIVVGVAEYQTLVASLDVGIIRPNEEKSNRQFLYGLFRTEDFQSHTFAHTSGTTVLHLAKEGVGSFQFSCPPIKLTMAFAEIAEAIAGRVQVNIDQMRNLATLRDTLLPRLVSGQLRLPENEATSHAQH